IAIADNPRAAAALIKLSGSDAPSRKLYEEWQCSSAQGITSSPSSGSIRRLATLNAGGLPTALSSAALLSAALLSAALSSSALPSSALGFPQERRRSNSRHGTGGLSQPIFQP